MKRIIRIIAAAILVTMPLLANMQFASAAVDTCTWTGSNSADWSDGGNWTGCDNAGVPENGDHLVFPAGPSNQTLNNDIAGLTPADITITGAGYSFAGNALTTVTSGSFFIADESANINLQVAFNGFNTGGSVAAGKTLIFFQPVAFGSAGGQYWTGGGTVSFSGAITGSAGTMFRAENGTTVVVTSAGNTYTSNFVGAESDGIFRCSSASCFGAAANTIYMGGGIVELRTSATYTNPIATSAPTVDNSILQAFENITLSGAVDIHDPISIYQIGAGSKSLQFLGGVFTIDSASSVVLRGTDSTHSAIRLDGTVATSGVTSSPISVINVKAFITHANTFLGGLTINADGIVSAESTGALGASGIGNETLIASGGELQTKLPSNGTIAENIQIAGDGVSGNGAIYNVSTAGDVVLSGAITLTADATIGHLGSVNFGIQGGITGTGNLTLHASNAVLHPLDLSGVANTYDGDLSITGGIIALGSDNMVPGDIYFVATDSVGNPADISMGSGTTDAIADTSVLHFNSATDFVGTNGSSDTIGGLASASSGTSGVVRLIGATDTLTINQNIDTTFSGSFQGAGKVVKTGTGTLTLTGDNVDTNAFTISNGSLSVNADLHTNDFTVNGGTLKGSGTVGAVTATSGHLATGNSPGCMTVASLTLSSGFNFDEEIGGTVACSGYDQTTVTGAAVLGNATLNVSHYGGFVPAGGNSFTILQAGSISGTFNALADGATFTVAGVTYRINYTATTVTLTVLSATVLSNTGTSLVAPFLVALSGMGIALVTNSRRKHLFRA